MQQYNRSVTATRPLRELTPDEDETEAKRRRLRKGTRSCWECKRRKVKCVFKLDSDATCEPCVRRGSSCVSQEYPEETSTVSQGENGHLRDRIGRVEDVLSNLVDELRGRLPKSTATSPYAGFAPTPISEAGSSSYRRDDLSRRHSLAKSAPIAAKDKPVPMNDVLEPRDHGPASISTHLAQLSQELMSASPSQEDKNILCNIDYDSTIYFYQVNTKSQGELENDGVDLGRQIGRLADFPSATDHPVILAKRMLVFTVFLQSRLHCKIDGLSEQPSAIMKRFADAAINVMMKEELLGSMESLECIILEAVYHANSGNLRRAWLAMRRAMMVAQMMGIHRTSGPPLKSLNSRVKINPQLIWFRIVYMDRLFSLLLGLPQGTSDRSMVSKHVFDNDTANGRLHRIHAMVAARIIERNERNQLAQDYAESQDIDAELLKAARSMPDKFWLPPKFDDLDIDPVKMFWETMRIVDQVYHYSLICLLHLPHSYTAPGINVEQKYEYSRIATANAEREILTRFVDFRSFRHVTSACRPMEFFALMAAMLLLITHLGCHRQPTARNFLAHQRLGDRAIVEQVLENMDRVAKLTEDAMMNKSASLIRRILDIDAEAAQGFDSTNSGPVREENVLRYHIPYLSVLTISRDGVSCADAPCQIPHTDGSPVATETTQRSSNMPLDHTIGNVASLPDQSGFPTISPLPAEQQLSSLPLELNASGSVSQADFTYDMHETNLYPDLAAGIDEWAFQGVDTAFFNSIMNGIGFPADAPADGQQATWSSGWQNILNGAVKSPWGGM